MEKEQLEKRVRKDKDKNKDSRKSNKDLTYDVKNFYAFKLKNRDLIPITNEVLKQMKLSKEN